jgi:hypothetical protein
MRKQGREAPPPWWQRTPGLPRVHDLALRDEARALLEAVRAYVNDPEWSLLDEEDAAATIHEAILPHWPLDDAERLIQAVADLDGGLRDEDSFLEELTAALRDGHAPELEIHTIDPRSPRANSSPSTTATCPSATDAASSTPSPLAGAARSPPSRSRALPPADGAGPAIARPRAPSRSPASPAAPAFAASTAAAATCP